MNRKRLLLLVGLAASGAAAIAQFVPSDAPADSAAPSRSEKNAALGNVVSLEALPTRGAMGEQRGELFGPTSWTPSASVVARQAALAKQASAKPAPPPIPYRVAGQVVSDGGMRVVLSKGDRIFEVREGETLDDGYRVDKIAPDVVKLTYVPLGITQELAVAGMSLDLSAAQSVAVAPQRTAPDEARPASAPAQPEQDGATSVAQLRFEGPQQVKTGKPFDVALKLTSPQPVRAMPMQLSFDAKHLEPIAVRPGDLFAGGNFTYRVNPAGSIFVGASGNGRAAADTNFLIVTFRPIAQGPAELTVSSLLVQGAAGSAIAHDLPKAFRAAIVQ